MKDYQLRTLIYDLWCNNDKLRQLHQDDVITMQDLHDLQDKAIELAKKDGLLS